MSAKVSPTRSSAALRVRSSAVRPEVAGGVERRGGAGMAQGSLHSHDVCPVATRPRSEKTARDGGPLFFRPPVPGRPRSEAVAPL
jgi:hypothetical protein